MSLQQQLVRLGVPDVARDEPFLLARRQTQLQRARNLARDLRLHLKQVCGTADVLLAPHLRPVASVDQLDADRETVIALQDPPARTPATSSARATSCGSASLPLYLDEELLATTFRPGSCERRLTRLSLMPSDR